MLLMFKLTDGQDTNWTPEKAIQHGKDMLRILGFDKDTIAKWEIEQRGQNPEAVQNEA